MKLTHWTTTLAVTIALLLLSQPALAADGAPNERGFIAFAAGLAIGLAALGGALGQGRAASASYESIARNPQASDKLFTPFILGMAFIESLVIFAFVVAFTLMGSL